MNAAERYRMAELRVKFSSGVERLEMVAPAESLDASRRRLGGALDFVCQSSVTPIHGDGG